MRRCSTLFVAVIFLISASHAQDFKKIVAIVAEMEASLKKSIVNEASQRNADVAAIRKQLSELQASLNEPGSVPGRSDSQKDIEVRLQALEKTVEAMQHDVKTKGLLDTLASLLTELKKGVDADKKVSVAAPSLPMALKEGKNPEGRQARSNGVQEQEVKHSADPLARLKAGNERFVAGCPSTKAYASDRAGTVGSQHPFAAILCCADSRVPPELIFDESLGQLFVVRDAGNLVDSVVLGSIEYAAEHLKVRMLVVLGHESCGAIKATIAGGHVPPNIGSLVRRLTSPVEKTKAKKLKDAELVGACVEENVRYQMDQTMAQSGVLTGLMEKGELTLMGAVYSLESGKVTFLEAPVHPEARHEPGKKNKGSHDR